MQFSASSFETLQLEWIVLFGALSKEISIFNNSEQNLNFISFFQLFNSKGYYNHLANKFLKVSFL